MQTASEDVVFVGHGLFCNTQRGYQSTSVMLYGIIDGKAYTMKLESSPRAGHNNAMRVKLDSAAFETALGSQLRLLWISVQPSESKDWEMIVDMANTPRAAVAGTGGRPGITFEQEFPWEYAEGHIGAVFRTHSVPALSTTEPCDVFLPNNTVFVFPNSTRSAPFLWAARDDLIAKSSYWRTMFGSGFSEASSDLGSVGDWHRVLQQDLSRILSETRGSSTQVSMPDSAREEKVQPIVITDTPLPVYRAVLCWLNNGKIGFAKLGLPTNSEPSSEDQPTAVEVYALAHQLDLDELRDDALRDFATELTVDNMVQHLFSQPSYLYANLRDAALEACKANWATLKESGALKHMQAAIANAGSDASLVGEIVTALLEGSP